MHLNRDMVAGILCAVGGALYSLHAVGHLPLGTFRQMGAGMFPNAIGIILAGLGICIFVGGLVERIELPRFNPRALVFVIGSVGGFAMVIGKFGLIPAVITTTVLASLAFPKPKAVQIALMCLSMAALVWIVFILLLKLNVPEFRWRF